MKILISAKPKSKKEYIKKIGESEYIVAVKQPAEKGKANQAVVEALAKFFEIPASSITLVTGGSFRKKIFEVPLTIKDLEKYSDSSGQIKIF